MERREPSAGVLVFPTDADLLDRARGGDAAAFDELYRRHAQAAWRVAQAVTRHADDAADATSEAFTRVMTAIARGSLASDAAFRPYLLAAARNSAIDVLRRRGRLEPTGDPERLDDRRPGATPADHVEGAEDASLVARAFNDLPERWRSVLWLTEVEGIPARQAGVQLGLSPNGAAQLAVRARAGLRERYLQAHLRDVDRDTCRRTTDHLGAYVAGGLPPRDVAKVDQHLAACADCRQRLAELEDLGSSLRRIALPIPVGLATVAAAEWNASRIAPLQAASTGRSMHGLPDGPWSERLLGTAAAAVFALGVVSATMYDHRGAPTQPFGPEVAAAQETTELIGGTSPPVAVDGPVIAPLEPDGGAAPSGTGAGSRTGGDDGDTARGDEGSPAVVLPATTAPASLPPTQPADPAPPPTTGPEPSGPAPTAPPTTAPPAPPSDDGGGDQVSVGVGAGSGGSGGSVEVGVGDDGPSAEVGDPPEEDGVDVEIGGDLLPPVGIHLP